MKGRRVRWSVCSVAVGGLYALAACGGGGGGGTGIVQDPIVVSVQILPPATSTVDITSTVQLVADVQVQNNARKTVTWASNAPSIASVDANGLVTGNAQGSAIISATSTENSSKRAELTINVNPPRIVGVSLNRTTLALTVGGNATIAAAVDKRGTINTTVTFTTSNPNAATVSSTDGVNATVTGVGANQPVTITATSTVDPTKSASLPVTVTGTVRITSVTPSPLKIGRGKSLRLVPVVVADNGVSAAVQYISQNTGIATVSVDGTVTGIALGATSVVVRAVGDPSVSVTVPVTVNSGVTSVTLAADRDTVRRGGTKQLTAVVVVEPGVSQTAEFSTANSSIATVSNTGLVTGVAIGQTFVRALSAIDQTVGDSTVVVVVDPCQLIQPLTFGQTVNGTTSAVSCAGTTEIFTYTTTQQTTFAVNSTAQFPMLLTALADRTLGYQVPSNSGETQSVAVVAAAGRYLARVVAQSVNQRGAFNIALQTNPSFTGRCAMIATTFTVLVVPMNDCGFTPQNKTGKYYSFGFAVMPHLQAGDQLRLSITTPTPIVPYVEIFWPNNTRTTANGVNQNLTQTFTVPAAGPVQFVMTSVAAGTFGNTSVRIDGPASVPADPFVFGAGILGSSDPAPVVGPVALSSFLTRQ